MTCFMHCVGMVRGEPRRGYTKNGNEFSNFAVIVKRNDEQNKYDFFRFEAWNTLAKYINENIHSGDMVSVVSRPLENNFTRKDGIKVGTYKFRVREINFICSKNKTLLSQFSGIEIPDKHNLNYDDLL